MRRRSEKHLIGGLLAFVLFAVFATCILVVLLTGADSYRRLTARDAASFAQRTAVQYVAAKVRGADRADGIGVSDFGGAQSLDGGESSTLFLMETIDGTAYSTRIYYYDGYIRELFTAADAEVSPEDGEKVLEARGLRFTQTDSLLTVTAAAEDGEEITLHLMRRSENPDSAAEGGRMS